MAIHLKLLIVFTVLVFASSCCYKSDCAWETNREITFTLNENTSTGGFEQSEASALEFKILNPINQVVEDSGFIIHHLNTQQSTSTFGFSENNDQGGLGSLKNKNLIFFLRGTNYADTVFNIDFLFLTEKKSCGSCFYSGPNYTTVSTLVDQKGTYRGKEFTESEFPITITKK